MGCLVPLSMYLCHSTCFCACMSDEERVPPVLPTRPKLERLADKARMRGFTLKTWDQSVQGEQAVWAEAAVGVHGAMSEVAEGGHRKRGSQGLLCKERLPVFGINLAT